MIYRITRRAALSLPLLLASCGYDESEKPLRRDYPPLRYGYLPPIPLKVQRVEMEGSFVVGPGNGEIIALSPVDVAYTLYAMARDRLKPVATSGTATFKILTASVIRRRDTMNGVFAVRLDVSSADGTNSGYAEARVTAAKTGPVPNQQAAIYDMLKSMMDNMNIEFEYQLRNKLRNWIAEPAVAPPTAPVTPPGDLPPPPPEPPPETPTH